MSQLLISRGEVGDRRIEVLELRDMCHALGISFADFTRQLDEELFALEASRAAKPEENTRPGSSLQHLPSNANLNFKPERTRRVKRRTQEP